MNPCSLSEEAMQAIVETYSSFGVDHYHSLDGYHYCVRGYRNKVDHLFGAGVDLCNLDDFDSAWALVYKLRSQRDRQQLLVKLQHVGIQCPVPGEGGDVHG